MLGRQTVREIVYRVLQGEQGGALRALASRDEHFARIARVLKHVHTEYAKPLSVEELARRAGMSIAAFHHPEFEGHRARDGGEHREAVRTGGILSDLGS